MRAHARGARAARDARRPHRARRRLPDRDARPRDPRRRRPARRRAVGSRRRARLRALRRDARTRRSPSCRASAALAARPVRVDARVDAYVPATYVASEALKIDLHRRLALAEYDDELRELHAGARGPLRPGAGARREPVRDPGGEAEARPPRRRLPRSTAAAARRSGRSCSARPSCARCGTSPTPPSTRQRSVKFRVRTDELEGAIELADAIVDCPSGGLTTAPNAQPHLDAFLHEDLSSRHPPAARSASHSAARRLRRLQRGRARRRRRRRRRRGRSRRSDYDGPDRAGEEELQDPEARLPEGRHRRSTRRCRPRPSRSSSSARSSSRRPRSSTSRSPTRRSTTGSSRSRSSTSRATRRSSRSS